MSCNDAAIENRGIFIKTNTSRRSRFAFGLKPQAYDQGRMSFSPSIVQWALSHAQFKPGESVLEIGAGTGQLTGELLAAGARVTALEPSDSLADLLQARFLSEDSESFLVSRDTFEEFKTSRRFKLVAAANSFHWLDPDVSYQKSSAILEPGGVLCLFWYFPILADSALQLDVNALAKVHELADLIREPVDYEDSLKGALGDGRNEVDSSGYLRCLNWVLKPQRKSISAEAYCDLLATYVSSKNLSAFHGDLMKSVFGDASTVELLVYEYGCVAAPHNKLDLERKN